ncbi:MAG: lectin-like protein [Methylobacter sp.]|nr:lectin-like protein [Methylobacter sp.]
MKNYNKNKAFKLIPVSIGLFTLLTGAAQADDSARLLWDTNGHYYQRFEGAPLIWNDAKTACESKSAHLATITSLDEQGFIYSSLLNGLNSRAWYHIGGTSTDTYTWTWVTGEKFTQYTNWDSNSYPSHSSGQNNLGIFVNIDFNNFSGHNGQWLNTGADWTATGYICEWSSQNYISTALVPDQNGNGVNEIAVLFVDYVTGKHTVQIKDPQLDVLLKTLVFATNFTPPSGMVVLNDTNNNGAPEIGVLFTQFHFPSVQIIDIKSAKTLKKINFMTPSFKPKSVNAMGDMNGNGTDEIVVLSINKITGVAQAEVRDSKTGAISNNTPF